VVGNKFPVVGTPELVLGLLVLTTEVGFKVGILVGIIVIFDLIVGVGVGVEVRVADEEAV